MRTTKEKWLAVYLRAFGAMCIVGLSFAVPMFFGDMLLWQPRNLPVELMMSSLYFAMGAVMIAAARNPMAHQSLIDFLIIGNFLHAAVMVVYAEKWQHIILDGGMVGLLGALPLFCYPWGLRRFLRYGS